MLLLFSRVCGPRVPRACKRGTWGTPTAVCFSPCQNWFLTCFRNAPMVSRLTHFFSGYTHTSEARHDVSFIFRFASLPQPLSPTPSRQPAFLSVPEIVFYNGCFNDGLSQSTVEPTQHNSVCLGFALDCDSLYRLLQRHRRRRPRLPLALHGAGLGRRTGQAHSRWVSEARWRL